MAIPDEIEKTENTKQICIDIAEYGKCYPLSFIKPYLTKDEVIEIYERLFCDEKRVPFLEKTALFIKVMEELRLNEDLEVIEITSTQTLYDNVVSAAALSFYHNFDTKDFEDYLNKEKIIETLGEDVLKKIERIYEEIKHYSYEITKPVILPPEYFGRIMLLHTPVKLCVNLGGGD